jgi:hypothetical protein
MNDSTDHDVTAELEDDLMRPDEPLLDYVVRCCRRGMRIFPVRYAPGSSADKTPIPGYAWAEMATSQANEAIEDFTHAETLWGAGNVMVAWAIGLNAYLAIDLDVPADDHPTWVAEVIDAAAINVTKKGQHLIFRNPAEFDPGNSTEGFPTAGWGDMRGKHGYIVIAGPDRPGFNPDDLDLAQRFPRPEWLREFGGGAEAVTWDEVKAFAERTKDADRMPAKLNGIRTFIDGWDSSRNGDPGRGRHASAVWLMTTVAEESLAGNYPFADGFRLVKEWFDDAKPGHQRSLRGITCWAIGRAIANQEAAEAAGSPSAAFDDESGGFNLPDAFWDAQPFLRAVRDAADAGLASREAVLGSALTRISALIPPATKLPAIIGGEATLDFMACIVAASSGGKTISNGIAKRLIPIHHTHVLADQSPGSGEGLIAAFIDYEKNEDGKKAGEPSYKHSHVRAVHLTADEGTGLHEQAGRSGTTIMQTLCSAWSGAQLGQLNASLETKRIVPAGKRRVAATLNIQTRSAHVLFEWTAVGLPQRILFCWAHGPLPDEDREFPDEYLPPHLPMQDMPTTLRVDPTIEKLLRDERRAVARGELLPPELDGHRRLLQLKTAALFALADGRRDVTELDWALAEAVVAASARVRDHISSVAAQEARARAEAAGRRQAVVQAAADEEAELAERQKVAALARKLVERVQAEKEISRGKLSRLTTSSKTRYRFDDALELAVENGCVSLHDGNFNGSEGSRVHFESGWDG